MLYIFLSILFNIYVGVIFKYFGQWNINALVAIVINYFVCIITGSIVIGQFPFAVNNMSYPWFPFSLGMGILFIIVFYLMSQASVKIGVTLTQAANKMSLAIPVLASLYLYHESTGIYKIVGLLFALIGVYLITSSQNTEKKVKNSWWLLPLIFIGSGLLDTFTKYIETNFINNHIELNLYVIHCFTAAFVIGAIFLLATKPNKATFNSRNISAGILLGIPNYFSIYFLVRALQYNGLDSSSIIPINNIGILLGVTLYGLILFKEKLSIKNKIGLGLAATSILLLFLS